MIVDPDNGLKTLSDSDDHNVITTQTRLAPQSNELTERRRAALAEIDTAKFGWFHVRAVLVSGVGFFTDAYDILYMRIMSLMAPDCNHSFAINIASIMLGYILTQGSSLTSNQDLGIKVATPVGTFCGQLLFGWLADVYGRKRMYGIAIRIRGRMMTAVFASQGFGQLTAALVALIVVKAFESSIKEDLIAGNSVDYCWRLLIGLGALPGAVALYFRLTIPETPRYTMDIERDIQGAAGDVDAFLSTGGYAHDYEKPATRAEVPKASRRDFLHHYSQWQNFKILFGCAWSWFALDVAFYGLGLNSSIVLKAIGYGTATTGTKNEQIYQTLINVSSGNVILSVAGLIPGYWVAFAFIDWWGRKPIQMMGFTTLTVLFIVMGTAYHQLIQHTVGLFIAFYCLANFFQNFGPNTSTSHGISAASGKLGAIIAQVGFARLKDIGGKDQFIDHIFQIFAGFMFTGLLSTFLLPETKGKSLEELSGEDQDGFVQS
ncbi:MFS transporter, PHS family, inorganic phosphate transporter protein [Puccinia sorghi]|uniref:MFS transporter, PHS family, inorganic phosphate transporter protein n=1 Tax=Puccinia sorghi TaxID=27349 RepID=A0A0L6VPS9_9BASI|nr:MFS transporter, PHS family, inorganic phosphate transporter protein [Puccinia sorghi]